MEILGTIPVTLSMFAVVAVAGFVQWNWRFGPGDMAFEPEQTSERGQWYRVLTSPVSHNSFGHILVAVISWGGTAGLMETSIGSWSVLVLTVFLTVSSAKHPLRVILSRENVTSRVNATFSTAWFG
jgi:membrane associated rhomboid family serine protease